MKWAFSLTKHATYVFWGTSEKRLLVAGGASKAAFQFEWWFERLMLIAGEWFFGVI
jgi:hypothetical protein